MWSAHFYFIMSELEILKYNQEEEKKKIKAWGGYGKLLYESEINFQVRAQSLIKQLINPITPDLIIEAEQKLALVKKGKIELTDNRIGVTSKFDPVLKRLMQPEKDVQAEITKNESLILKAKIAKKNEDKLKEDKQKELKQIEEHVRLYVADMHASYLETHNKLIADSYKYALDQKIPLSELNTYLDKVRNRITLENQATPRPQPKFSLNTPEDVEIEIKKHFNPWKPEEYVKSFRADLNTKFSDWANALKNPDLAIKLNDEEFNTNSAAISDLKSKETVAVKLDAISTELEPVQPGRSLKEVYKLPEPLTMEDADIIINAYCVHRKECKKYIRKISPMNFGVKQMISVLESLKNDDNNFSYTGLNFKLVETL